MPIKIIFPIFVPGCETLFFTKARENEYLEVYEEVQRRVRAFCFGRRVLRWGRRKLLNSDFVKGKQYKFW